MYGMMFDFLREYVIKTHGGVATWRALLKASSQSEYKIYFPISEYPDEEIVTLTTTAATALDLPLAAVLEDFGSFVGPRLMEFYRPYVEGHDQDVFTVVQYAGGHIHDQIHKHNPDRKPPLLSGEISESDPRKMIVHYQSKRKMCSVVRGVLRGLGSKFGERLHIEETQCMHTGADKCTINVIKLD